MLIEKIKKLVAEERRIGVEVLECLREIEKVKAYSSLGYSGLFSFCVRELKYSEAQAYRRIEAMRAMTELPQLKEKIITGELSVTTVSQVRTYLKQEKIQDKSEKLEVFASFENKSAKEVEQTLRKASFLRKSIEIDEEMECLWNRVKDLSAHKTKGSDSEILRMLLKSWLTQNDPALKKVRRTNSFLPKAKSRYVPASVKQFVWKRDQGKCQNCGTTFALQIDHIQAYAKNGLTNPENLRLLCRSCNIHHAIQDFGASKAHRRTWTPL